MGVNKNLDLVRGRILATKPLPSLQEAFPEVRREENRKKVMLGELSTIAVSQTSALTTQASPRGTHPTNENRQRKGRLWCDHCKKSGHSHDTCRKIHGKPAD